MRNEQDVIRAMEQYADTVRRLCMIHLKSYHDSEDIFQNVFLKYVLSSVKFESEEHEKAWFIRVVINICYDIQKSAWFSRTVAFDEVPECEMKHFHLPFVEEDETLWHVMELPAAYRNPLYLFYYEDYSIHEIAGVLNEKEGTIKTRLRRGREEVKKMLIKANESEML